MRIQQITNIEGLIYGCFSLDPYYSGHRRESFDECCEQDIEALNTEGVKTFCIFDEDEFVAYFATLYLPEGKELTGFFIDPKYRKIKDEVWSMIEGHFGEKFYNAIYKKNLFAIKFCEKKGKEITNIEYNNETVVIFEYKGI